MSPLNIQTKLLIKHIQHVPPTMYIHVSKEFYIIISLAVRVVIWTTLEDKPTYVGIMRMRY